MEPEKGTRPASRPGRGERSRPQKYSTPAADRQPRYVHQPPCRCPGCAPRNGLCPDCYAETMGGTVQ